MSHSCIIFNGNLYLVPLGRRRLTWEGEIEVGLQEFFWGGGGVSRGLDDKAVGRDRWRPLVNAVTNLRVP